MRGRSEEDRVWNDSDIQPNVFWIIISDCLIAKNQSKISTHIWLKMYHTFIESIRMTRNERRERRRNIGWRLKEDLITYSLLFFRCKELVFRQSLSWKFSNSSNFLAWVNEIIEIITRSTSWYSIIFLSQIWETDRRIPIWEVEKGKEDPICIEEWRG